MKSTDIIGGKYRLTHRLGSGAMGVVWAAINERTGRRVALKLIINPTDDLRQRLLREGRACGKLMHRNIVEVYDVGETESGDPFLVMQLLSGETLAELLRRKRRIAPRLVARVGADIASALAAAHEAKIIHRDLKPANIFLHREESTSESEFSIKVLDFGVCKNLASRDGPSTTTGMLIGSLPYMSPEQVRVVKDLDHRTDIWSLGIILFEMLTGVRPFRGTMDEVVGQILLAPIPPVSSLVWRVPAELDAIVARCLSRDRDARIHDANELSRMLSAFAEASRISRVKLNISASAKDAVCSAEESEPDTDTVTTSMMWVRDEVDDEATTLSLDKRHLLAALERERSAERLEPKTEIMSPTAPVASPMPTWRLEMQKVLASRKPSSSPRDAETEDLAQGGTLALAVEALSEATATAQPEGVPIPSIAPLVQQVATEKANQERATEGMAPDPARSRRVWLYATVGALLCAFVVLGMVAGTRLSPGSGKQAQAAPSPAPVPTPMPTPTPLEQKVAMTASVIAPPPSISASSKAPPPHPSSTSSSIAPQSVSVARPRPTAHTLPAVKAPESCGLFLKKKNCQQSL